MCDWETVRWSNDMPPTNVVYDGHTYHTSLAQVPGGERDDLLAVERPRSRGPVKDPRAGGDAQLRFLHREGA